MALYLGDTAPNFTQQSSEGEINFYDWAADSWVVLFLTLLTTHPFARLSLAKLLNSSLNLTSGMLKSLP